jgi:phosphinothricin acetyltransferase
MQTSIIVRHAIRGDLHRFTAIYNQAVEAGMRTADTQTQTPVERKKWLEEHLNNTKYPLFAAEINGNVVGYLSISPYRKGRDALRYAAEVSYYVDFNHHKKGVGSALMNHALHNCKKEGLKTLFAILLETNIASISLLSKYGFEKWATLPNIADFGGIEISQVYYGKRLAS